MRRKYPWADWEDGKLREVDDADNRLAGVLRTRAARRGLRVRTRRTDRGRLQFQFLPPGERHADAFDATLPAEVGSEVCPTCGRDLGAAA